MKIVSPTFPVKYDVIYWKPHGRITGYIKQQASHYTVCIARYIRSFTKLNDLSHYTNNFSQRIYLWLGAITRKFLNKDLSQNDYLRFLES